jgi:hypothetical protein
VSERNAEIPWAISNTVGPVLDVGCAESTYIDNLPGPVDGIDVRVPKRTMTALRRFYQGDICTYPIPRRYATVLAVSTIEHIGLACKAYGTAADDVDGDRHALEGCLAATAPAGQVLLSVPFGKPAHHGWFRQYDLAGLARLLDGCDATIEIRVASDWDTPADVADVDVVYDHRRGSAGAVALVTVRKD